jgi:hypothetical protein
MPSSNEAVGLLAQGSQGNDFGLAAISHDNVAGATIQEERQNRPCALCAMCLCPVPDDGTGYCMCDECAALQRQRKSHRATTAQRVTTVFTTGALMAVAAGVFMAIMHLRHRP